MLSGFLSQTQPKPQTASVTITKLCDRLQHSTLLEDRRAAVLGLKGFSREYRETVAAGGLRGLISALHRDSEDAETCRATLETLLILFMPDELSEDQATTTNGNSTGSGRQARRPLEQNSRFTRSRGKKYSSPLLKPNHNPDNISLWLTDEFTQKQDNIITLLELVEKTDDFFTKLYALQLLSAIISNRPLRSQECILAAPLGISSLVACLDDYRDVIRNEAILLLLYLVSEHFDMQKLVAFEGTFDKLFSIIDIEGGLNGGVVVEEAISLLSALLRYNVSNQHHFRETNCVPKLVSLLENKDTLDQLSSDDSGSLSNAIIGTLELCRLFVIEDHWSTPVNQQALCKEGLLFTVLRLAFGVSTPMPVRCSAFLTAAALVRGNSPLQEEFLAIDVPYFDLSIAFNVEKEPLIIPVSLALLNWVLLSTSVHTFDLRVAAQLCLSSALQGNIQAKLSFLKDQMASYPGNMSEVADELEIKDKVESRSTSTSPNLEQIETNAPKIVGDAKPQPDYPEGSANLFSALVDYDPDARLNPYKPWFAAVILINLFEDADISNPSHYNTESHEVRDFVRGLMIGDASIGEEVVSCIQAMSGMLVTSLRYPDPRISLGYLMLLSIWLYDDTKAVSDFLGESGTIQALISSATHSSNNDPLVEALSTVLLGIVYDFSSAESPIPR
ncbi:Uso1p [Sugiyamaella lignohabitans]|uniref:Uso1p n=1 Tax=Sugiyamaella lignohabitans TaxID=796027 RepID=A0A167C000_9ASCO|nr:Uso1p [Sugiyamaella lignohabitans]ANB11040.1 Uso1p [Sugiyamaella lignohabitans]